MTLPDSKMITITARERRVLQPVGQIPNVEPENSARGEDEDWRAPFRNSLQHGGLPEDKTKRAGREIESSG